MTKKISNNFVIAFAVIVAVLGISILMMRGPGDETAIEGKPMELSVFEKLVIENSNGDKQVFKTAVARSKEQRARGFMFFKHVDEDVAMLFKMENEEITRFWMKNTYISLDILFIDSRGEIKKIHQNAKPLSEDIISSDVPVLSVLEINGGIVKKLGIAVGDKVSSTSLSN